MQISESEILIGSARSLVTAAAALWRAACLSDRVAVYEDFEEDDFFLTDQIIAREFGDDPSARSFFLHMSKAREALTSIATAPELRLLCPADVPAWDGLSFKECWVLHQTLLDQAVERFEAALT